MQASLTMNGKFWPRILSFVSGLGMIIASILTIRHYFLANFPTSIFEGAFCDINEFFNCDSSAFSLISQVGGIPLGYFGLIVGALVSLGVVFPSAAFERTNKAISLFNFVGIVALFCFSVFYLNSLCLLCTGFYVSGIISFFLFWKYGIDKNRGGFLAGFMRPSLKHLAAFGVVMLAGAYGFYMYNDAKVQSRAGVAMKVVREYYSLPKIESPSIISPFMSVQSTEQFEEAPIQIIEYADFLCPDCLFLYDQLKLLKDEFKGKINIAFQFFPLEAKCNDVVDKDRHPGACDLSYVAAYVPEMFAQMHDEIFDNFYAARDPEWRMDLARRYGAEGGLEDSATRDLVHRIINTGMEYEKTHDQFAHGIRSTPTMIINNRLVIGTLPYEQLKAIFQALVDEHEGGGEQKFMENWVPPTP